MLRHVISPARCFAQIPNAVIRHPRLSSHAVHLLAWQVSLPEGANEPLSATAQRARIRKTAFQKAKRELLAEGYLHEWRVQVDGGRFTTVQLISNVTLTAEDAVAVRDGHRQAYGRARLITDEPTAPRHQQPTVPGAGFPAVGEPSSRGGGRQPQKNTGENTTNQPPVPEPESQDADASDSRPGTGRREPVTDEPRPSGPEPVGGAVTLADAEALLRSFVRTDNRLAIPARTARRWAPLVARWLATGLQPDQIRRTLTQGLADARSPLGVLRWRLEHALPDIPPPAPTAPRPEPRVARMRECAGTHLHPRLFTPLPGSEEMLCRDCRADGRHPAAAPPPPTPTGSGYERFRAARRALRPASQAA
ncbi:MAG: hypothetical protein ACRDP3_09775 [Streptomyces sp.]|uniref:hypothetical protein n=1 Tax=Streptomyces sp. TaxID=1931 RepID=UPI003D6A1F54